MVTIPGEVCKMQAAGNAGAGDQHGHDNRPSGFHRRSVFARIPARSLSASPQHAGGRSGGVAGTLRDLGDGPASGSPRRVDGLADLLFLSRCWPQRFPERAAVAPAQHHSGGGSAAAYPHPRSAHPDFIAGCDQHPARDVSARGRIADRASGRAARIRRHCRPGRGLSAKSVSGRGGSCWRRPREPDALRQHGIQLVRTAQ
jgi:hypothetical protein